MRFDIKITCCRECIKCQDKKVINKYARMSILKWYRNRLLWTLKISKTWSSIPHITTSKLLINFTKFENRLNIIIIQHPKAQFHLNKGKDFVIEKSKIWANWARTSDRLNGVLIRFISIWKDWPSAGALHVYSVQMAM